MGNQTTLTSIMSLSMREPDIAVLTINDPEKGANVLSRCVLEELNEHLDSLEKKEGLAGLVIRSGKPGTFIAGADIREFVSSIDSPKEEVQSFARLGHQLFGRLCSAPFVTVAAIDGLCLGGGAELSIWCDRRLMTTHPKAQFGFPEVKLGLFPGWGGTARTPRVIGLSNAVELITSGEPIDAAAALAMNLVSDVVESDRLDAAAIELIRAEQQTGEYKKDRQRWAGTIEISETELGFLGAIASAYITDKTKGQYPAPLAALETMLGAAGVDLETACQMEAEGFSELFGSPINRSLINVFFLHDGNKKDPGVADPDIEPLAIGSISVIGAGIMGQGIAAANLRRRLQVNITDASSDALGAGVAGVLKEVSYNKAIKGPDPEKTFKFVPLLNGTTSDAELAGADLVIEAVVENLDIKKQIFARLEPQLGPNTILASNTSTIPITKMAEGLKHPDRFCGIHFFNPVRKMPLVEVIRGEKTSDQTIATAVAYAKALGKSPVVVGDGPGFLVNRLLLPYMNEALELLIGGVELRAVEKAAKVFGMPMGPVTLYDVVGIDTALHAGRVMVEAFPDRMIPSQLLIDMFEAEQLGEKTGAGFYLHTGKKGKRKPNPKAEKIIAGLVRGKGEFTPQQLTERLFLPMLVEATRVLEDGLVRDARDVDLALIFGIGFPPFKGGLLYWADTVGAEKIVEMLKPYESLGKRYQPTEMLLDLAKTGNKFYDTGETS